MSQQELEDAEAAARDCRQLRCRPRARSSARPQLNLSYTEIRSPVTGIAGLAQVRVGNLVGQDGPTLLTTVSEVDPIRVNFPLSEVDYVRGADRLKQLDGRDRAWADGAVPEDREAGGRPEARRGQPRAGAGRRLRLTRTGASSSPSTARSTPTTGTIQLQALFPNPTACCARDSSAASACAAPTWARRRWSYPRRRSSRCKAPTPWPSWAPTAR